MFCVFKEGFVLYEGIEKKVEEFVFTGRRLS